MYLVSKKNYTKIISLILVFTLTFPLGMFSRSVEAKTSTITIKAGKTKNALISSLKKSVKVTWKISNKKIAKVVKTINGDVKIAKIKGLKAGKTTLRISYKQNGKNITKKCTIIVKGKKKTAVASETTVQQPSQPGVVQNTTGNSSVPVSDSNMIPGNNDIPTPVTASPSAQNPVVTPSPTPKVSPTKTPKPTKTPGPTAPAKTTFELNVNNAYILNEYDEADITYNNDGSIKIVFDTQYEAVNFYLPNNDAYKNSKYTQVTIEYTSTGNALGYALFNSSTTFGSDHNGDDGTETGKFPNWDLDVVTGTNVIRTIRNKDVSGVDFIRGIQLFNPASSGTTIITIKSMVFE